jgi:hypothetical protein
MTAFTVQAPPHAGQQITMTLPTTGAVDTVPTGPNIALLVTAPSSASMNVTLPIPNVDATQTVTGRNVVIATANTPWLIPLPSTVYGPGPITLTWAGTLTASGVAVVAMS